MIRLLVFSCLLAAVFADNHDKLVQKYGQKKIYESCFGKALLKEKQIEIMKYVKDCKTGMAPSPFSSLQPVRTAPFDWNTLLSSIRSPQGGQGPIFIPIPVYAGAGNTPFTFGRKKRATYFTEEKIRETKNRAVEKMNMALCVLKKSKVLNANSEIQWGEIETKADKLNFDDKEFQADLIEVMNKCKNFAVSLSSNIPSRGPVPKGLKQMILYLKCEQRMKIMACMKKDLRKNPTDFQLKGLDGILDGYADEDEQMLKVIKMYLQFGDDELSFLRG